MGGSHSSAHEKSQHLELPVSSSGILVYNSLTPFPNPWKSCLTLLGFSRPVCGSLLDCLSGIAILCFSHINISGWLFVEVEHYTKGLRLQNWVQPQQPSRAITALSLLPGSLCEEETFCHLCSSCVVSAASLLRSFACHLEFGANRHRKKKGRMNSDLEVNDLTWTIEHLEAPRIS